MESPSNKTSVAQPTNSSSDHHESQVSTKPSGLSLFRIKQIEDATSKRLKENGKGSSIFQGLAQVFSHIGSYFFGAK